MYNGWFKNSRKNLRTVTFNYFSLEFYPFFYGNVLRFTLSVTLLYLTRLRRRLFFLLIFYLFSHHALFFYLFFYLDHDRQTINFII